MRFYNDSVWWSALSRNIPRLSWKLWSSPGPISSPRPTLSFSASVPSLHSVLRGYASCSIAPSRFWCIRKESILREWARQWEQRPPFSILAQVLDRIYCPSEWLPWLSKRLCWSSSICWGFWGVARRKPWQLSWRSFWISSVSACSWAYFSVSHPSSFCPSPYFEFIMEGQSLNKLLNSPLKYG